MGYGHGTIEPRRGKFRLRLPDGQGGYRDAGTFDTREAAEGVRRGAVALRATGEAASSGDTLREYGARWLDRRELDGARDDTNPRNRWKNHVEPAVFIDWPLANVARSDVKTWLDALRRKPASDKRGKRKIGAQTVRHCLNLLRACFQAAIDDELLTVNPAAKIKAPSVSRDDGWTYLVLEEQRRLLGCEAIPASERLIIAFALGSGLRQGEQWCLELRDVHIEDAEPWVYVRWGSPGKPPKNGRARKVVLFGLALEALRAWAAQLPAYTYSRAAKRSVNPLGLAFPTARGCRRREGKPLRAWAAHLEAAGLATPERRHDGRPVRWHDLRHTCASALVSGMWGPRWRLEEVREQLGHRSAETTLRYAHLAASVLAGLAVETRGIGDLPQTSPALPAPRSETACFPGRATEDSNLWPSAPEADGKGGLRLVSSGVSGHEALAGGDLGELGPLARRYLQAVESRNRFAHRYGVELADAVLRLAEGAVPVAGEKSA